MATIPPGARAIIESGPFGHVVTINPDGTPHVSLAWVGFDGDELIWSTFRDQAKIANLRRDPRISVAFQAKEDDGGFLYPYVVVKGTARIEEGGALAVMDKLAPAYIGQDTFPMRDVPPGLTIRVTIESVYGMGTWKQAPSEGTAAS